MLKRLTKRISSLKGAKGVEEAAEEDDDFVLDNVFELHTLIPDTSLPVRKGVPSAEDGPVNMSGRVRCSVPFSDLRGRRYLAVGCDDGIWACTRYDSLRWSQILPRDGVTQCAYLQKYRLFLLLAKKELFAYSIDEILDPPETATGTSAVHYKLVNTEVEFFSVGTSGARTFLVYTRKPKGTSVINVHVIIQAEAGAPPSYEWFSLYKEFYPQYTPLGIQFLPDEERVTILRDKGFEFMSFTDLRTRRLPERDVRKKIIEKRYDSPRPIGIFRPAPEELLLCYDRFGLYVNYQGGLNRGSESLVEWKSRPKRIAAHGSYLLLFDENVIEIRRISSLQLVQLISGANIECIYDARPDANTSEQETDEDEFSPPHETQICAVMQVPSPRPAHAQHVFELYPKQPF